MDVENKTAIDLASMGDWLQALGGVVSAVEGFENEALIGPTYNMIGNFIQAIGNSMQALSKLEPLGVKGHIEQRRTLNSIESWIQAVGAILSTLGLIESFEKRTAILNKE
ncbi:hypothetical protein PU629_20050 [Pullulanibacillus sp. KACC 23026]|uniref:DUF6944 family repetitive protein n=1 Tax=Pullulanibacillus sp. KACC 23026 TaxID=3028315 RepID=UPI0023B13AD2|nr:hypothetical protein [Pullulanibacillus sp. KACC 23026]WEG12362.1 hypothetical protein PU629_20050 [Pullulanibacillus sp. KACC 23026]